LSGELSTLRFLYSLRATGIKAGLGNIRVLLNALGHPERVYPTVHVAGTNGKGSTSAMIASALTAAGYRTGLYTSPHLVDFTERIRIDGRKMPMQRVAASVRRMDAELRRTGATFFEATTAAAFSWFAEEGVDIAVIETGLGGRWDSTNVVTPLVSVITSIGLEHREYLGGTIRKIAFEKAGIVKRGVPCVVGEVPAGAMEVIARRAAALGARLIPAARRTAALNVESDPEGVTADFRVGRRLFPRLRVAATGLHQAANARVALAALEALAAGPAGIPVGTNAVREGFASLRQLTGFSGRLQILRRTPPVLSDVAHNPDGVRALTGALRALYSGKFRIVFGVMIDKDYRAMIDLLRPHCRMFTFVAPASDRTRDAAELVDYAHRGGSPARIGGSVRSGVAATIRENRSREPVLITGSHYVVGEAMEFLRIRP